MEHHREMKNEISSKDYFLKRQLADYEKPSIYSLEAEFAKTRRNHDYRPFLVFFGFIALLGLSTMGTAQYLEIKSKQVEIDISDFEDLRLKETLSAAAEIGDELNKKTAELDTLKTSYQTEIGKLKREITRKSRISPETGKGSQPRDLSRERKRLQELEKQYEKKIAQKQSEITRLRKDAKLSDADIEEYQRYYQLQLRKQKESYETKIKDLKKVSAENSSTLKQRQKEISSQLNQLMNVFEDEQLIDLSTPLASGGDSLVLNPYRKELGQEDVLNSSAFRSIRRKIDQLAAIQKKLRNIPETNPASPPLKQTRALTFSIINDYERLWNALTDRITRKNNQINLYQHGISSFLKDRHATGCVLDSRQPEKITLYYLPNWDPDYESIVELYREKKEYIGKLKLTPSGSSIQVQILEVAKGKNIRPLDWFRLPVD